MTTAASPLSTFTPALKPPPGVQSNPEHPASLATLATITLAICVPVITLFFVLRSYVRFWVKRLFTFEDVLCIMLWAGTVAFCGIMRNTMAHGGGMHMWDISPEKAHEMAYWFNLCAVEYGAMIGLGKVAVLSLYRRVFSPRKWSTFDTIIFALIVIITIFYAVTTMVKIFECWPRDKIWNKSLPGKCVQMKWILNVSGGFNTLTDWIIFLLPIHAIRQLQMTRSKKILVFLAFTFGACAPIFATVGFVVRLKNSGNKDVSWKQPEITLWGAGELTSGNLIVCFPELAALFQLRAWRTNRSRSRRKPGISTIRGWSEPRSSRRMPSDPYMTKSLMGTNYNGDDGEYMELNDHGNEVRIARVHTADRPQVTHDGVVVRNEFKVETHKIQ